jgi:hypothetical protein
MTKHLLLAALLFASACASRLDMLTDTERDHYAALKVWMDDDQEKAFFKLKTEDERNAFLKSLGIWDRFYGYSERERGDILGGRVAVGWTKDKVYMAWGAPHEKQRLTGRRATRSELFTYRFEVAEDGRVLVWEPNSKVTYKAQDKYQIEVYLDDDRVTEMVRKDGWE